MDEGEALDREDIRCLKVRRGRGTEKGGKKW